MFGQNTISSEETSMLNGKVHSVTLKRSYILYDMGAVTPRIVRKGVSSLEEAMEIAMPLVKRGNRIAVIEDCRQMKFCGTVKLSGVVDCS